LGGPVAVLSYSLYYIFFQINETNAPQPDRPPTYNVIENVNVVSVNFSSATRPIATQQIPNSADNLPPSYEEATFEQNGKDQSKKFIHFINDGFIDFFQFLRLRILNYLVWSGKRTNLQMDW
jgi:hypothetical protein